MNMKKVLIITESLSSPLDEGIKKAIYSIFNAISKNYKVLGIYLSGDWPWKFNAKKVPSNRLLISKELKREIKAFSPDKIIYIPHACGTIGSLFRGKVLGYYSKDSIIMILMQPRIYRGLTGILLKLIKPSLVISPSPTVISQFKELSVPVDFLPLVVDGEKFHPVKNQEQKTKLRRKYGLPEDKRIILHVGHFNKNRNLEKLIPVQEVEKNQVLIVGSTSTPTKEGVDKGLMNILRASGIMTINNYIPNIEEIFQSADVYMFPVEDELGCIGIPLSILEARACGLPVITTQFGGIKKLFGEKSQGIFYSEAGNISTCINKNEGLLSNLILSNSYNQDLFHEIFKKHLG